MARKTFISYKYSESRDLRDKIIEKMGDDASYYKGETSDSPDLTDLKTDTIKSKLKDMIYDTSVTIVILSPNMKESNWIDWEIEYSLKEITREDRTSRMNGIVAVVQKVNGNYDWLINHTTNIHGTSCITYNSDKIFPIIYDNNFNSNPPQWHCDECKTYDYLNGGYITFVKEDEFLSNINHYIENAYEKSQHEENYNIKKQYT